ncbi:MAG: hypothetical protein QOE97_2445 [Pseudonocardiales bacterium]|nr:hypothetical protein [Pseudonocardiales bacterium]
MTAMKTVDVICPNCRGSFRVPDGAAETLCAYCNEHIVWRQCLDTTEIFPVLTRWETWVHPGCQSVHVVDLSVTIQRPAPTSDDVPEPAAGADEVQPAAQVEPAANEPAAAAVQDPPGNVLSEDVAAGPEQAGEGTDAVAEQPAAPAPDGPVCAMDSAEWVERDLQGRLMIDGIAFGIEPPAGRPVAISWTRDVLSYTLDRDGGESGRKRRFRRGAQPEGPAAMVVVVNTRGGTHTIRGLADADELAGRLEMYLRPAITANESAQAQV